MNIDKAILAFALGAFSQSTPDFRVTLNTLIDGDKLADEMDAFIDGQTDEQFENAVLEYAKATFPEYLK